MSKKYLLTALFAATSLISISANSEENHSSHKISAPAGIMSDHLHKQGEYMLSYSYETMGMKGYLSGSDDVTTNSVLADYDMAATNMSMKMQMFNFMYGVTDSTSAMLMVPYISKEMSHIDDMGDVMSMKNSGLGDISVSAVTNVFENHDANHNITGLNLGFGLNLPTGDIDKMSNMGGMPNRMNYDMQLGSGTFDPSISATLYSMINGFYTGVETSYLARLYDNDNNYQLGDEAKISAWVSTGLTDFLNASFRLTGTSKGKVSGSDTEMSSMMMPGGEAKDTGGERVDAFFGFDMFAEDGKLASHKLQFEYGVPVYQDLNGTQMEFKNSLNLNYKMSF
jgi:hypothetical protein